MAKSKEKLTRKKAGKKKAAVVKRKSNAKRAPSTRKKTTARRSVVTRSDRNYDAVVDGALSAISSGHSGETLTNKISGDLTIYTVGETKELILRAIISEQYDSLDLSGVSEVDTAGFQLLLSAQREAQARGRQLKFVNASSAVEQIFSLYRMNSVLNAA